MWALLLEILVVIGLGAFIVWWVWPRASDADDAS